MILKEAVQRPVGCRRKSGSFHRTINAGTVHRVSTS
jgi:hypothetical protein